ncbi:MAG TPA: pyridoxamine 5'-phosphate oxidase family protein [Gaiellaceae bacterium]|nr:pyridoxamine 5'-phosphate oxidase family protein [Gaiellaceae bacterium]
MENRLASLLDARLIATLATTEPDGSAYLSAVWFLCDGDEILIATGGRTRKARNAAERPGASLLIDTRGPGALRGAAATGTARVVRGPEALANNERVWAKYLSPAGRAHPNVGVSIREHDDVTIVFTPDAWRTWGTDEDFGGALEQPGIAYPLES